MTEYDILGWLEDRLTNAQHDAGGNSQATPIDSVDLLKILTRKGVVARLRADDDLMGCSIASMRAFARNGTHPCERPFPELRPRGLTYESYRRPRQRC